MEEAAGVVDVKAVAIEPRASKISQKPVQNINAKSPPLKRKEEIMMVESGDGDEDETGETRMLTVPIGNPKRALWKRTVWNSGRSLHARLFRTPDDGRGGSVGRTDGTTTRSETVLASGSLVYEAAITSVLTDDMDTASRNPTLSKM